MSDENLNQEHKTKTQIICDAICGILMLTSILVYIILGVTINFWHPGWIIIVSAAIVCGFIGIIINSISSLKNINKKKNDKQ